MIEIHFITERQYVITLKPLKPLGLIFLDLDYLKSLSKIFPSLLRGVPSRT